MRTIIPVLLILALAAFPVADERTNPAGSLTPSQTRALRHVARGESARWEELTSLQATGAYEKATEYQRIVEEHLTPHGLVADVWWKDGERSEAYRYEGIGDSAANTGYYLATLALRYHVERDATLLPKIMGVLDSYDVLSTISGREGYIARYAAPADSEAFERYYSVYGGGTDPDRPGLGKRAYVGVAPREDWVWLGSSSRDMYDGVALAVALTWRYVEQPDVRGRLQTLVARVGKRLIDDGYRIDDGQGNVTLPNPPFQLTWQRLLLTVCPEEFGDVRGEYETAARAFLTTGVEVRTMMAGEYYLNNLRYNRMFSLCTLEQDPALIAGYRSVLRQMYEVQTADHLNAYFAAVYLICAEAGEDHGARAVCQGLLVDFPPPPKFLRRVFHGARTGDREEVHEDCEGGHVKFAQLVSERVPSDFQWQRSPTLCSGGRDLAFEYPGLDMTLVYWMGRLAGIMPAPEVVPLAE